MLSPHVLHLYGPLWINSYGLMIVLGLMTFMWLSFRHPLRVRFIPEHVYSNALLIGIVSGVFGGRFLYALTEHPWHIEGCWPLLYPWEAGFSLLGAVIAIPLCTGLYLRYTGVSALLFLDLAALYAPLLQAISRIGCFLAGCCYGIPVRAAAWWTVIYTHPDSLAPQNIPLHPAQLYSSVASLLIFIVLQIFSQRMLRYRGVIFGWYLVLEGSARYLVDLWRAKTTHETLSMIRFGPVYLTDYQVLALAIVAGGLCMVMLCARPRTPSN